MRLHKLAILLAFLCSLAQAQTTTTFTGTIKDLTNSAVTSGNVTFTLQPGADTTISGSARFTPQTVTCGINGSGLVKANDLTNPCVVTNNTALTPAGTSYKVQICPAFACTSSLVTYALGGSVDITTLTPTPAQMPAYSLVDIFQNQTIGGNKIFTGSNTFTLPILSNPTGTALTAAQPGFPATTPQAMQFLGVGSSNYFPNPALYISRVDTTPYSAGNCFIGPLAACDAPIVHIEGTNQVTSNTSAMVGVEVDLWGFKSNGFGSAPFAANYNVAFGGQVSDAAVDNIADLRGANLIVDVFGNPTHPGTAGFVRSGVTLEGDVNNASGVDAVAYGGLATAGNYIGGVAMNMNGNNSASVAYAADSSAASGKGWRAGYVSHGITEVGHASYVGGAGAFSPTYDFVAQSNSTVGFLCGKGTAGTAEGTNGNPATCLLLDALGTTGNSETVNSGVITFRAKNASSGGTDWQVQHIAGTGNAGGIQFTLIGAASYFKFGNSGQLNLNVTTGTAPFVIASTTPVANLSLSGGAGTSVKSATYASDTNCAVNSVSPAACGAAAAGGFVVPTTTTTYTVNTTAVTAASRIFLQPITFASNLPSAPTCVAPAAGAITISAISAGTSFTFALPSTTGTACFMYHIID